MAVKQLVNLKRNKKYMRKFLMIETKVASLRTNPMLLTTEIDNAISTTDLTCTHPLRGFRMTHLRQFQSK